MLVLYLKWLPKSFGILEYQIHLPPEFFIEFSTGCDIAWVTLMWSPVLIKSHILQKMEHTSLGITHTKYIHWIDIFCEVDSKRGVK